MEPNVTTRQPTRILLQTTIGPVEDDWHIGRFSLLRDHLASLKDTDGQPRFEVTARDRAVDSPVSDPVLSQLDRRNFDELWLFAVDNGDGLNDQEAAAIQRFWQDGGGVLVTRDHQDLGSSVLKLGELGSFHFFHTQNPDPDPDRCCADDTFTTAISWPNYHSGSNGDYQQITPQEPVHELIRKPGGLIEFYPAHPHEGAVGIPAATANAKVIATGKSKVTGRSFNLAVAYEKEQPGQKKSRVVAESTFHHFVDYNWDTARGCPSFLGEAPGHQIRQEPAKLSDIKAYVQNLATWLAPIS